MSDNPAFENIYSEFAEMVYNLCLSYVRNQTIAEDLSQDVFVRIYKQLNQFEGKSSLKTWVYRITVNSCLDYIKYNSREKRKGFLVSIFSGNSAQSNEPIHFDHPGVKLENKESVQAIFNLIDQLPDNQKTALILKTIDGLSTKEIADIMDASEKSIESLIGRGRKKLKELLIARDNNE